MIQNELGKSQIYASIMVPLAVENYQFFPQVLLICANLLVSNSSCVII